MKKLMILFFIASIMLAIPVGSPAQTTVYFSDDFESGLGNWLISNQDWAVIETDAVSGTKAITESPDGNYLANANAAITLLNPIDLSSSTAPVLTFWHKYFTQACCDFARVEISEDNGFTWTQLAIFSGFQSTWSPVQLDLSPYKTTLIKVRFRFTSNEQGIESDGWSIDDVQIRELNQQTTPFPLLENFEGNLSNWSVSTQDWAIIETDAVSGTKAITESPDGNYPANANAVITLFNPIDLSSSTAPVLTFWHKYFTQACCDFARVEISEDNGFTWTQLTTFSGFQSTWFPEQLDLSPYKRTPIKVRFRFTSNIQGIESDGWSIDDVHIKELGGCKAPGIIINRSENRLITTETEDSVTFDVRLSCPPSADVILDVSSSDSSEGVASPSSLTFTPLNWNSLQTVTVTGQNDTLMDGDISYIVVVSVDAGSDSDYLNLDPVNLTFTNLDADIPPPDILVSGISSDTSEDGDKATFTVRLLGQLASNVIIDLESSDRTEGTVSPISLTFTPANANNLQIVTVTGRDDNEVDGDVDYLIQTSVGDTCDPSYCDLVPADVQVINIDNDGSLPDDAIIIDDFDAQ